MRDARSRSRRAATSSKLVGWSRRDRARRWPRIHASRPLTSASTALATPRAERRRWSLATPALRRAGQAPADRAVVALDARSGPLPPSDPHVRLGGRDDVAARGRVARARAPRALRPQTDARDTRSGAGRAGVGATSSRFHPEDVVRLDDWRQLPFLTKEELRDAYPYGLACAREAGYVRVQMSSGTTGSPILNPYTASDVAQWGEVMARCYVAAGVGRDDVIQITPSFGLFTGGFCFPSPAPQPRALGIPTRARRAAP